MAFIGDIEVHPAADLFPEMEKDDRDHLRSSIKEHGVRIPVVFHQGKLLDGRNRVRACKVLGIPSSKIPRRNLDPATDPFEWAWDANCARLDYSPAQKAAIRIKIDEASGELQRAREEARERANRSRSEKLTDIPRDSRASPDASLFHTPREPRKTVAAIAEKAHVSPRTVERVFKLKKIDAKAFEALARGALRAKPRPPRGRRIGTKNKNWSVPRAIPAMATYLKTWLTSAELSKLIELLEN